MVPSHNHEVLGSAAFRRRDSGLWEFRPALSLRLSFSLILVTTLTILSPHSFLSFLLSRFSKESYCFNFWILVPLTTLPPTSADSSHDAGLMTSGLHQTPPDTPTSPALAAPRLLPPAQITSPLVNDNSRVTGPLIQLSPTHLNSWAPHNGGIVIPQVQVHPTQLSAYLPVRNIFRSPESMVSD